MTYHAPNAASKLWFLIWLLAAVLVVGLIVDPFGTEEAVAEVEDEVPVLAVWNFGPQVPAPTPTSPPIPPDEVLSETIVDEQPARPIVPVVSDTEAPTRGLRVTD